MENGGIQLTTCMKVESVLDQPNDGMYTHAISRIRIGIWVDCRSSVRCTIAPAAA